MEQKPFPHQVERAKDLLGLIHTDVRGLFRTVSREGASYFITITYDFSRYGYVYLMKHKHEGYALESAARILNMVPTKKVDRTPYENGMEKLPRYPKETMGYYFYYPFENKIDVAQNAKFFENSLTLQEASVSHGLLEASESDVGLELIQKDDTKPSKNTSERNDEVEPFKVEPHSVEHLKAGTRDLMRKSGVGFTQNPDEPYVYLKASGSNVAFPVLYVDDILIMGNNVTMLQDVKSWLCKCFSIKDLEEATYILGIKIIRDRSKRLIALSQSAYFDKILKKFKMENSKCGCVLMQEKPDYRKS
ncbi:retrotransposon protein, putative, ty1-copia subclass [Tanacetum coccineum]